MSLLLLVGSCLSPVMENNTNVSSCFASGRFFCFFCLFVFAARQETKRVWHPAKGHVGRNANLGRCRALTVSTCPGASPWQHSLFCLCFFYHFFLSIEDNMLMNKTSFKPVSCHSNMESPEPDHEQHPVNALMAEGKYWLHSQSKTYNIESI